MKINRTPEAFRPHFSKRARRYDASARWVCDKELISRIFDLAKPEKSSVVLDLAVGTGRIAEAFKGKTAAVIGLDACDEISSMAKARVDCLVRGFAEEMPFPDNTFDICTCRQGLPFMEFEKTLAEVRRVLKPGGRVVLGNMTSYGGGDDETMFLLQRLRCPARKNFFSPGDVAAAAKKYFSGLRTYEYVTRESVKSLVSNGTVTDAATARIMKAYGSSPEIFRKKHSLVFRNGDILDSMRMELVAGRKRRGPADKK